MHKAIKTPEQALSSLMSLCSKAERSSDDAMRLMARWGVEPSKREGVLLKLIETKFIDDRRYAAAYVREKSRLGGWGVHKIRAALAAKSIAHSIIDQATAAIDPRSTADTLAQLLRRKARTAKAANAYELHSKLVRYGLSRGFDYEAVLSAAQTIIKPEED